MLGASYYTAVSHPTLICITIMVSPLQGILVSDIVDRPFAVT